METSGGSFTLGCDGRERSSETPTTFLIDGSLQLFASVHGLVFFGGFSVIFGKPLPPLGVLKHRCFLPGIIEHVGLDHAVECLRVTFLRAHIAVHNDNTGLWPLDRRCRSGIVARGGSWRSQRGGLSRFGHEADPPTEPGRSMCVGRWRWQANMDRPAISGSDPPFAPRRGLGSVGFRGRSLWLTL